jgi:hypothetical protein
VWLIIHLFLARAVIGILALYSTAQDVQLNYHLKTVYLTGLLFFYYYIIIIIVSIIIIYILTILINNYQTIFLLFQIIKNIIFLQLFQIDTILSLFQSYSLFCHYD